jgi:hypothetical protein
VFGLLLPEALYFVRGLGRCEVNKTGLLILLSGGGQAVLDVGLVLL